MSKNVSARIVPDSRGLDPAIHVFARPVGWTWMPLAVSAKPLAAAGTSFLREPGTSPGMTVLGGKC